MKKILQSLLLTLMFIAIFPIGAYAEEANKNNSVAYSKTDGKTTYHKNIVDAVNYGMSHDVTIIMLKDWELKSAMNVVEGTTLKINLDGHSIKRIDDPSQLGHNGEVITLHPNSKLYLYGSSKDVEYTKDGTTIKSGGFVSGGNTYNGGGVYMKKGAFLHLERVAVCGNHALNYGGGIYTAGDNCVIEMVNAKVSLNSASFVGGGGGITLNGERSNLFLENNSEISYNSASTCGGGVLINENDCFVSSKDHTGKIINNTSGGGGAIYVDDKYNTISYLTLDGNSSGHGGAVYFNRLSNTLSNLKITNNKATKGSGGGVCVQATMIYLEDCIITNNSSTEDGGGVYVAKDYVVYLKKYNKIADNTKNSKKNNIFLETDGNTKAYLRITEFNTSSSIGVSTGLSGERLLVRDAIGESVLSSFLMDDPDKHYVSCKYDGIWQKEGTANYTLYLNNEYSGIYKAGFNVDVNPRVVQRDGEVFKSWSSETITLSDVQKYNSYLQFTMPLSNVYISYTVFKMPKDVTLNIQYPKVGETLAKIGTVTWNGKSKEISIDWYKENGTSYTKVENYVAQDGETYYLMATINKDADNELGFTSYVSVNDISIKYENSQIEQPTSVHFNSKDGSVTLTSKSITLSNNEKLVSVNPISFSVNTYITKDEFVSLLNEKIKNGSTGTTDLGKELKLSLKEVSVDDLFNENGYLKNKSNSFINLNATINNIDNVNLDTYTTVSIVIKLETNNSISFVEDLSFTYKEGTSLSVVKENIPSQVLVTAHGTQYIANVDKSNLDELLAHVNNEGVLKVPTNNTFAIDLPLTDNEDKTIGDAKLKVILTVQSEDTLSTPIVPTGGVYINSSALALVDDLNVNELVSTEQDYKFNENGFSIKAIADEGATINYEISGSETKSGTCKSSDYILLGEGDIYSLTIWASKDNIESSKLTVVYILSGNYFDYVAKLEAPEFDYESDTYIPSDLNATVNENSTSFKFILKSSYNIKYFINDDYEDVKDYDKENGIVLTCNDNEKKSYVITAWTEDNGITSNTISATYILDCREDIDISESLLWNLLVDIKPIEVGENLPNEFNLKVVGQGTSASKTIELNSENWGISQDKKASYSTVYTAKVNIDNVFNADGTATLEDKQNVLADMIVTAKQSGDKEKAKGEIKTEVKLEDGEFFLYIIMPITEVGKYTLNSIEIGEYTNTISYVEALSMNNDLSRLDLPYILLNVTDEDNNQDVIKISGYDLLKFDTLFDSSNSNAQEIKLVINEEGLLPTYVSNPNNLDTNISLTIKVDAKKNQDATLVDKKDAISKTDLTDIEKELLDNNDDATIDLKLNVSDEVDDKDVELVDNNLNNYKIIKILDLTLTKIITYKDTVYTFPVSSTTSPIEISIAIDDAYINKVDGINRIYKVLRIHNNNVDFLDAPFNSSNKTIAFKTDEFSTYALVYLDTYNTKPSEEVVNKVVTCEEYMNSKNWTWSEIKKACVYKVSNTSSK